MRDREIRLAAVAQEWGVLGFALAAYAILIGCLVLLSQGLG
jgi:hypothetical protein